MQGRARCEITREQLFKSSIEQLQIGIGLVTIWLQQQVDQLLARMGARPRSSPANAIESVIGVSRPHQVDECTVGVEFDISRGRVLPAKRKSQRRIREQWQACERIFYLFICSSLLYMYFLLLNKYFF